METKIMTVLFTGKGYMVAIPKAFVDLVNLKKGDKIQWTINENKLTAEKVDLQIV